jgi:23S rRNA (cytidine2498-2'-O)-methyltransferase
MPDQVSVIAYCRQGFEKECAAEIADIASARAIPGHPRLDAGYVEFRANADEALLQEAFHWRHMVFARQCLGVFARIEALPRGDRLAPIMQVLSERGEAFNDAWVEAPDTEPGKELTAFCRSFGNALIGALKKARLLEPGAPRRMHAFFPQGDNVYLCVADPATAAPWPLGIPRLKFPREAPSRSTLKLEEGFLTLLTAEESSRWLRAGMSAVDLGASPGGWTWQLVRRSLRVVAIDNGPMDRKLMDSGLVTHRREDGFRYRPSKPVDWLVCDMVEQPRRVAALIASWLEHGWCRRAMFNLKLPMKKRFAETRLCLDLVRAAARDVRAKHLYHDREEITVFAQSG